MIKVTKKALSSRRTHSPATKVTMTMNKFEAQAVYTALVEYRRTLEPGCYDHRTTNDLIVALDAAGVL